MKRISWEDSLSLIPLNEMVNKSLSDCKYFTLVGDKDGWEKVFYFTGQKRNRFNDVLGEGTHWIYVLENKAMPGIYKIGFTKDDIGPQKRSKQVSRSSGVPVEFTVKWAFKCFDGMALEQQIHKKLDYARVNSNREFFAEKFEIIKQTIETLGQNYIKHGK